MRLVEVPRVANVEIPRVEPFRQEPQVLMKPEPRVMMVNRNKNANEVLYQVQQNNIAAYNNLEAMVETIMARNGVHVGLTRPNYTPHYLNTFYKVNCPEVGKS